MKKFFFLLCLLTNCVVFAQQKDYPFHAVDFTDVKLSDNFWLPRLWIRRVVANQKVGNEQGKVALQRGPIMYCGEWKDNGGKVSNLVLPTETKLQATFQPALLNGIVTLAGKVPGIDINNDGYSLKTTEQEFVAIPYYAWANRGKRDVMVWFPEKIVDIDIVAHE